MGTTALDVLLAVLPMQSSVVPTPLYKVLSKTESLHPSIPTVPKSLGIFPFPSLAAHELTLDCRQRELLRIQVGLDGPYLSAAHTLQADTCLGQVNGKAWSNEHAVSLGVKRRLVRVEDIVVSLGECADKGGNELQFMIRAESPSAANVQVHGDGSVRTIREISAQEIIKCTMICIESPMPLPVSTAASCINDGKWVRGTAVPGDEHGLKRSYVSVSTSHEVQNELHVHLSPFLAACYETLSCYTNNSGEAAFVDVGGLHIVVPSHQFIMFPSIYPAQEHGGRRLLQQTIHLPTHSNIPWIDLLPEFRYIGIDALPMPPTFQANKEFIPPQVVEFIPPVKGTSASRTVRSDFSFTLSKAPHHFDEDVEIRTSTIPGAGAGLFTLKNLKEGDAAGSYHGDLLHFDEWKKKEDNHKDYGLSVPNENAGRSTYIVDGYINFGDSKGRFINEGMSLTDNNVKAKWFSITSTSGFIYFAAKKDIPLGTEIFLDYGAGYPRSW